MSSSHCGVNLKDHINTNDDSVTIVKALSGVIVKSRIEKYMVGPRGAPSCSVV